MCGWQWGVQVRTSTPHLSHLHQPVNCFTTSKLKGFSLSTAMTSWIIERRKAN